jgi:hypothetical protein
MEKMKLSCAPSNFAAGRPAGMQPEAIVLHRTGGSADQIRVRFLDGTTVTSAHYCVGLDGGIVQYVAEQDTAFHAGMIVNPTWTLLKPRVNPNFYTIGIELEGSPDDSVPDQQSDACAALVAEVAARCGIGLDKDHIVLHSEIRASRNCPGSNFRRDDLLQKASLTAISAAWEPINAEIDILRETNLREGLPSSSVRIVSVLPEGSKVRVNAFTLQGESVKGNRAWYQTTDGSFFWAGNSSRPQPVSRSSEEEAAEEGEGLSSSATAEPPPAAVSMPGCPIGVEVIDGFFANSAPPPVELSTAGPEAVGVIQDLLTGHGFSNQPSILAPGYGACGNATSEALRSFQNNCGLTPDGILTSATMKQLVALPAKDPRATEAHLSLVLGIPFTGMDRVLAITAQMEGAGKFAAFNLNTDFAGLSFGIIQWSQSTGRLLEIVGAFRNTDAEAFVRIFGAGDPLLCDRLIQHLKKPNGGVVPQVGTTTDSQFNLISSPWVDRFKQAAVVAAWQQAQVSTARKAFEGSLATLREYDTAGLVKSERAVAFMLDVANQFGNGKTMKPAPPSPDRGLAGLYRRVFRQGIAVDELLEGIAEATVAAMPLRFQAGVRARRNLFLTTPLFSKTEEFQPFSPERPELQALASAAGGG